MNGCAIGGAWNDDVNNLIINGGNITAIASNRYGIGARQLDNLKISGGNIIAKGGEYGGTIGSYNKDSGEILIEGGNIYADYRHRNGSLYSTIGNYCNSVKIEGGTIVCNSSFGTGIGSEGETENIRITGGNIIVTANNNFAIPPSDGSNDVCLTRIKLANVTGGQEITSLTTSDNIPYGIKDMHCSSDDTTTEDVNEGGMLYLYLPEGSRIITITANGKTYSGQVITSRENNSITTLNEN